VSAAFAKTSNGFLVEVEFPGSECGRVWVVAFDFWSSGEGSVEMGAGSFRFLRRKKTVEMHFD
jgi:hypothetical protein